MDTLKKGVPPLFPQPSSVGERDWGTEEILVLVPGKYMLKKLFVRAGKKGGLQYHRMKDESGTIISGKMIIRYDDGNGGLTEKIVSPGDSYHFPPGVVHQEEAITDCIVIEASTNHFNDRVRCEAIYGIDDDGGLPTTQPEEIIVR